MKNIVICFDGTGNEASLEATNVLRMWGLAQGFGADQRVYYETGAGTRGAPDPWKKLSGDAALGLGLATGAGLGEKIIGAYEFLAENYVDKDRIFIFGFSRGAYAARVLAAMIHKMGLLPPDAKKQAGVGLSNCEELTEKAGWDEDAEEKYDVGYDKAFLFGRKLLSRMVTIHFVGVWDTVASLIRPNPKLFLIPTLFHLKFTRRNPSVKTFRHAMAIDERRRMFQLDSWIESQKFVQRPVDASEQGPFYDRLDRTTLPDQDSEQVWFAGVHADVGGGYEERDSGLSKYSLIWMIDEAMKAGLQIDKERLVRVAWGKRIRDTPYKRPTLGLPQNNMNIPWRLLEFIPKLDDHKQLYIPNAEPRAIPEGASIHKSVFDCMKQFPEYRPKQLLDPGKYKVVAMPVEPN